MLRSYICDGAGTIEIPGTTVVEVVGVAEEAALDEVDEVDGETLRLMVLMSALA